MRSACRIWPKLPALLGRAPSYLNNEIQISVARARKGVRRGTESVALKVL